MDGFDIIEKIIPELLVVDLKDILEYVGLDTKGAKKVLQDRLIQAAERDVFRFKSYVLQMRSNRLLIGSRLFHLPEYKATKRGRSMFLMDTLGQYDFHSDIQVTTALLPDKQKAANVVLQLSPHCSLNLKLSDEQKELIFGGPGGIPTTRARAFLRLGLDEDELMIEDTLPRGVNVAINGKQIPLPDLVPCKRGDFNKRFGRPLDITNFLGKENTNDTVSILWHQSEERLYLVSIFCAERVDIEDLLMRIRRRPTPDMIPIETLIKNFFQSDDELSTLDECIISLNCPLVRNRIKYPCRGRSCRHIQCFDAENYLQMNITRPKWKCPICALRTFFYDLNIDAFTDEILHSDKLRSTTNSIKIDRLGNWTENVATEPEPKNKTDKKEKEIITLDSDEESEGLSPPKLPRIEQSLEHEEFVRAPLKLRVNLPLPIPPPPPSWPRPRTDNDEVITID